MSRQTKVYRTLAAKVTHYLRLRWCINCLLLCATSVFSVPLWLMLAANQLTTETQRTQRLHREIKLRHYKDFLLIQAGVHAGDVRNPKHLSIDLQAAEPVFRQILFFQTEECKVRQVAQHGLKPAMFSHDLADSRVLKLVDVECKHRDVLRRARRRNRIKDRLGQIFTEINSGLFEFKNFGNLL